MGFVTEWILLTLYMLTVLVTAHFWAKLEIKVNWCWSASNLKWFSFSITRWGQMHATSALSSATITKSNTARYSPYRRPMADKTAHAPGVDFNRSSIRETHFTTWWNWNACISTSNRRTDSLIGIHTIKNVYVATWPQFWYYRSMLLWSAHILSQYICSLHFMVERKMCSCIGKP